MKKKEIKRYSFIALLALIVCIAVRNFSVISNLFKTAFGALVPLVTGCIIAYIFNIIMNFYERHYFPKNQSSFIRKSRRPVCVAMSFASAVLILVLVINIVYPELVNAITLIADEIPPFFTQVQEFAKTTFKEYPEIQDIIKSIEPDVMSITQKIGTGAYQL